MAGTDRRPAVGSLGHRRAWVVILGICLVLALLPFSRSDRELLGSDWTAFATGAALAVGAHPDLLYDRAAQQRAQDAITGGGGFALQGQGRLLPFLSPPWVALVVVPFTRLGLGWGARLFVLLQVAAVFAGVAIACPGDRWAPLAAVASFPALVLVVNAQLDGLVVLGLGLALAASRARRQLPAGLALGLTLVKPHLVVPLACALLLRGRWRLALGWLAAVAGLAALVTLRDWRWLPDWYHATASALGRNGREIDPGTWAWWLGLPERQATLLAVCVTLAVLTAVLAFAARAGDARGVPVLVAGGVLVAPHALASDLVLVALAMALAGDARPWQWAALSVAAAAAAMVPEPWPSLVTLALIGGFVARTAVSSARQSSAPRWQ